MCFWHNERCVCGHTEYRRVQFCPQMCKANLTYAPTIIVPRPCNRRGCLQRYGSTQFDFTTPRPVSAGKKRSSEEREELRFLVNRAAKTEERQDLNANVPPKRQRNSQRGTYSSDAPQNKDRKGNTFQTIHEREVPRFSANLANFAQEAPHFALPETMPTADDFESRPSSKGQMINIGSIRTTRGSRRGLRTDDTPPSPMSRMGTVNSCAHFQAQQQRSQPSEFPPPQRIRSQEDDDMRSGIERLIQTGQYTKQDVLHWRDWEKLRRSDQNRILHDLGPCLRPDTPYAVPQNRRKNKPVAQSQVLKKKGLWHRFQEYLHGRKW